MRRTREPTLKKSQIREIRTALNVPCILLVARSDHRSDTSGHQGFLACEFALLKRPWRLVVHVTWFALHPFLLCATCKALQPLQLTNLSSLLLPSSPHNALSPSSSFLPDPSHQQIHSDLHIPIPILFSSTHCILGPPKVPRCPNSWGRSGFPREQLSSIANRSIEDL